LFCVKLAPTEIQSAHDFQAYGNQSQANIHTILYLIAGYVTRTTGCDEILKTSGIAHVTSKIVSLKPNINWMLLKLKKNF
jgi:hypothetical protein